MERKYDVAFCLLLADFFCHFGFYADLRLGETFVVALSDE
jgi:hypothetical protein